MRTSIALRRGKSTDAPGGRFWLLARYHRVVDKRIRKFSSVDDMKAEELRYWQGVSARERMQAIWEITLEAYRLKGGLRDVPRLQRTLVRIQRR